MKDKKPKSNADRKKFDEKYLTECPFCGAPKLVEYEAETGINGLMPYASFRYSCEDCMAQWFVNLKPSHITRIKKD